MKNRWVKRIIKIILGVGLFIVLADVGLHFLSGRAWVHQQIARRLSDATGREVQLGHVRLNLRGAAVEDFILAKPGGLSEGKMLHINKARIKVSLWHLLHGQLHIKAVDVNGLSFHLVRDEQGRLNTDFSTQSSGDEKEESSAAPFDIAVKELRAHNVQFIYTDQQTALQTELKNLDIRVRNFSWEDPFEIQAKTNFVYTQNNGDFSADVSLNVKAALNNLDLSGAYADISSFTLRRDNMRATLSGHVENFTSPSFDLKLDGQNISSEQLMPFVSQDFPFTFAKFSTQANGNVQPEKEKVEFSKAGLTFPGAQVNAKGTIQWASNAYDVTADATVLLDNLAESFPVLKPYALGGNLTLQVQAAPKGLDAKTEWLDGKLQTPQAGKISALQVVLDASEQWDFQNGKGTLDVNGMLNGEPFKTNFSFDQTPRLISANLKAYADRVVLPPADKSAAPAQTAAAKTDSSAQKRSWPLPPITAKADVQVLSLDAPYLRGNDLDFKLDMSGITPRLDKAHGTLQLAINDGQITDLYHLTDSNALMKVLFMSLNVVGKVFNSLDVLSVLGGLAGSSKSDDAEEVIKMIPDENGEMVAVKVPASSRKVDGKLAYDKFATEVQFDTGVATVKKGSFVSDMMSFNLSGTTNFKTEKIDMTVHAAPGKHETDGIMPLTLKIGGTVSEPSGNMSVVGSVASLVKQGVTNNFASRAVKKGVGGFFGLFKKEDAETTVSQDADAQTPGSVEESL